MQPDEAVTNLIKKKTHKLPEYMLDEDFNKLINLIKKKHHKLAFILGFHSGLRVSEVVNLKKEDINIKSKRIFIRQGKGGKDRVVPLPKGFPTSYLKHIPLKCGIRSLQIAFKSAINRAKLNNKLHFHSLRHSFAVRCMDKGIPLNQIQILLGHSNIQTTSIYLKINPQDALNKYEEVW